MMIATPKTIGRAISLAARPADFIGNSFPPDSSNHRTWFSIITTAPSTIIPKSIAPRLIKFALMPKRRMPRKLISIDNGITNATTMAADTFPKKISRTIVTRRKPSKRFFSTVRTVPSITED